MTAVPPITDAVVRDAFDGAADWFLDVVGRVPADRWGDPGLGEWTVRELVAHAGRAFLTIELYLADPPAEVTVPDVPTYFRLALAGDCINADIAARARVASAELGDDVVGAMGVLATRARALAAATADDAPCGSAAGGMRFSTYLATRVFELTVHTVDLCAALDLDDQPPDHAATVVLAILADLAATSPSRADVIRTLTGRPPTTQDLTIFG